MTTTDPPRMTSDQVAALPRVSAQRVRPPRMTDEQVVEIARLLRPHLKPVPAKKPRKTA